MSKPLANFNFSIEGLSVKFTDSSSGVPTSWSWNFGFSEGSPLANKVSTLQNPGVIVFPEQGIYRVSLIVSNSEGVSTPYIFDLVLSDQKPVLFTTIEDMVSNEIPLGIPLDDKLIKHNKQKWQLFLQPLVDEPYPIISDADVYNELKWPPLANVLISKLIIYELILSTAKAGMAAFRLAYSQLVPTTQQGTQQVADFSYLFPGGLINNNTITITSFIVDGVQKGPSTALNSNANILAWFNNLGIGHFFFEGDTLKVLASSSLLTTIGLTYSVTSPASTTSYSGTFSLSNPRVVPLVNEVSNTSSTGGMMGSIKYIESGPSKTEWYDGSTFWNSMFKGTPGSNPDIPGSGSIFENIVAEICSLGKRLNLNLPMCKPRNLEMTFQVLSFKGRKKSTLKDILNDSNKTPGVG